MDNETRLRLEESETFLTLRSSASFRAILSYLHDEVESAKGKAILGPSTAPTSTLRRDIIAWQEREKIVLGIESIFDEHDERKKTILEGEADERRIAVERAGRSGW